MSTPAISDLSRYGDAVGERVELGRYRISSGERVIVGQRVNGVVRVSDVPADGGGRAYLVERGSSATVTLRSRRSSPTTSTRPSVTTSCRSTRPPDGGSSTSATTPAGMIDLVTNHTTTGVARCPGSNGSPARATRC